MGRHTQRIRWLAPAAIAVIVMALGASPIAASELEPTESQVPATAGPASTAPTAGGKHATADPGPRPDTAGTAGVSAKVVGGSFLESSEAPWTGALVLRSRPNAFTGQFCGGTLIAPDLVLTAAHCVTDLDGNRLVFYAPGNFDFVLGRTTLSTNAGERHQVVDIDVHPAYEPLSNRFDFAVLRLGTTSNQNPVALPNATSSGLWGPGVTARVAGWGRTVGNQSTSASDSLRTANLVMQADSYCQSRTQTIYRNYDPSSMLCAVDPGAIGSACHGDSGGPLTVFGNDGRHYLVGVVSWGVPNCPVATTNPNVYAWVPAAYDWINRLLAPPYQPGRDVAEGIALDPDGWGWYTMDGFGTINPGGLAPRITGGPAWPGFDIARGIGIARTSGSTRQGYVLDGFGGRHGVGGLAVGDRVPYWPGWDIARDLAMDPGGSAAGVIVDAWGGLHRFNGSALATAGAPYWRGWDIVRGVAQHPAGGGYVLDGWGGIHAFGGAPRVTSNPYWRGWDIARSIVVAPDGSGGLVLDGFGGTHRFTVAA